MAEGIFIRIGRESSRDSVAERNLPRRPSLAIRLARIVIYFSSTSKSSAVTLLPFLLVWWVSLDYQQKPGPRLSAHPSFILVNYIDHF